MPDLEQTHHLIHIHIPRKSMIGRFQVTLKSLGCRQTLKYLAKSTLFFDHYYILDLRLSSLIRPEKSRFSYFLKTGEKSDFQFLVERIDRFDLNSRREIVSRLFFQQAGFRHCYFAKTPDGQPVYMQWLIYPDENEIIAKHFRSRFYPLKPNQIMLENAFTFRRFRGLGLLPNISAELLTIARDQGYKTAVTYIQKNQIVSLNEFMNMNFKIRKIVREYKILGVTKRML